MKLIFVYNADSGAVNALLDGAHKALSPSTYNCSLCAITHNVVTERATWKKYRQASEHEMVFLHRDEFARQFRSKWLPKYQYPVILEVGDHGLQLLISKEEIDQAGTPEELIALISSRTNPD